MKSALHTLKALKHIQFEAGTTIEVIKDLTQHKIITQFKNSQGTKNLLEVDTNNLPDDFTNELVKILNISSSYSWKHIKELLISYLTSNGKEATYENAVNDYSVRVILGFISDLFSLKYELIGKADYPNIEIKSELNFNNQVKLLLFDEVSLKEKINKIIDSSGASNDKAKKIVKLLIEYFDKHLILYDSTLTDPDYTDNTPFLTETEEWELKGLWETYNEFKEKLNNSKESNEDKIIKDATLFDSYFGERLNHLNNHKAKGGTLSFSEIEKRKRENATKIVTSIRETLWSYNIDFGATNIAGQTYFTEYSKKLLDRTKIYAELNNFSKSGKDILEKYKLLKDTNWDSDSLTIFGIFWGIFITISYTTSTLIFKDLRLIQEILIGILFFATGIIPFILVIKVRRIRAMLVYLLKSMMLTARYYNGHSYEKSRWEQFIDNIRKSLYIEEKIQK